VFSILAQRKAKSMQRAAEKIISTGEEKRNSGDKENGVDKK
jgi:hypothetical protein